MSATHFRPLSRVGQKDTSDAEECDGPGRKKMTPYCCHAGRFLTTKERGLFIYSRPRVLHCISAVHHLFAFYLFFPRPALDGVSTGEREKARKDFSPFFYPF